MGQPRLRAQDPLMGRDPRSTRRHGRGRQAGPRSPGHRASMSDVAVDNSDDDPIALPSARSSSSARCALSPASSRRSPAPPIRARLPIGHPSGARRRGCSDRSRRWPGVARRRVSPTDGGEGRGGHIPEPCAAGRVADRHGGAGIDDGRLLSRAGQPAYAFAVRMNRSRDNAARSDRGLAWVTGPPLKIVVM